MAKLLILGPSYRRNQNSEPLPAIERYDGVYYRIVRKYMNKLKEKNIDIIIITEDLNVLTPKIEIPYKPPVGEKWRTLPPTSRDPEKIKKLQSQIIEIVRNKKYDEAFIALNRYYQAILPDLRPYIKRIISNFGGLGPKAKALKQWLSGQRE